MKVVGLDGRQTIWKLSGCRVLGNDKRTRSGLHVRARILLSRTFPMEQVLEEVPIPGSRLRGDFYVATRQLMVEVNGIQHYEFNPHFHKTKADFLKALRNDADKRRFCELNNIKLAVLRHDEDDDGWAHTLREA